MAKKDNTYLTFTVDKATAEILEALKREFSASSKAEVLRKAISLLEMAREARDQGGNITIQDKEGVTHRILI